MQLLKTFALGGKRLPEIKLTTLSEKSFIKKQCNKKYNVFKQAMSP